MNIFIERDQADKMCMVVLVYEMIKGNAHVSTINSLNNDFCRAALHLYCIHYLIKILWSPLKLGMEEWIVRIYCKCQPNYIEFRLVRFMYLEVIFYYSN